MMIGITWTMVVLVSGLYSAGATSIEGFTSLDACRSAIVKVEQHYDGAFSKPDCFCVAVQ